jgi:hypothetical protein
LLERLSRLANIILNERDPLIDPRLTRDDLLSDPSGLLDLVGKVKGLDDVQIAALKGPEAKLGLTATGGFGSGGVLEAESGRLFDDEITTPDLSFAGIGRELDRLLPELRQALTPGGRKI